MRFNHKPNQKKKNEAFLSHFRLLGLNTGECRTNVIRSAALRMSIALSFRSEFPAQDHVQWSDENVRRARIALAAYRLLDPRERTDVYERVQLCYPIDRDDEEPQTPPAAKLIDRMPKVRRPSGRGVRLMGQPLIDEAIEGKSSTDEEPGGKVTDSTNRLSSTELTLEERRGIVRLMRESDESSLRGLSPLGWLRLRLGI